MTITRQNRSFLLVFVALLLSGAGVGAAQDIASAAHPAKAATGSTFSLDTPATPQQPSSLFVLGVADVIRVNVWKNPDLSQSVTVGPDGFVSLPLIGDIHVAGMTASQLGKTLAQRLTTYMVTPQVTVSLIDIRSRQVYVLGQVQKPGGYPLIAPITVLQLIAEAGGLGTYANTRKIFILRGGESTSSKLSFDYAAVLRGKARQNFTLQPGDTVVVP